MWTSSPDEPSDGDCDALTALVQEPRHLTCRLALRFVDHLNDANDATQESLIRIVTRLGTFERRSSSRPGPTRWVCSACSGLSSPGRILDQGTQGVRRVPMGDIDSTIDEVDVV
jgi:hypothetical protein